MMRSGYHGNGVVYEQCGSYKYLQYDLIYRSLMSEEVPHVRPGRVASIRA